MWLKIEPREPLILGEARADSQFLTGQTYIPARVLRGAWAEWLLRHRLSDEDILAQVNRLRLGNLFPAAEWANLEYALPLPMSALSCKRSSGFRTEPVLQHQGHGVVDSLLPLLAYRLLEGQGARFPVPFALVCRECGDRMEPFGGFYALYRQDGTKRFVQFRPSFHGQTKVGLSRFRRGSAEGMLYTVSALSPYVEKPDERRKTTRLVFVGRIRGDSEALADLKEAVLKTGLGALHTRGYGRIEKMEEVEVTIPLLEERIEAFNRTLRTLWQDIQRLADNAEALPKRPEAIYFSVDLLAPGVFHEHGVPTLRPVLNLGGRSLTPIWWMTRPDIASGWSTAWGLSKPTNLAARMGSVYMFRWDGSQEDLIPILQTLEDEGIGERRDEGFGECLICHPFHQEVEER